VLDPFNGAGTTSRVAWDNCRRFIGIDISPEYCSRAFSRVLASRQDRPWHKKTRPPVLIVHD
jgi:DNA modification methylase